MNREAMKGTNIKPRNGPPNEGSEQKKSRCRTKNVAGLGQGKDIELNVQEIINALPFYVMIVDADHNILETNEAVFNHLGVKREDVVGKYCPRIIHGMDHPFEGCPLEEAVGKNQTVERELLDEKSGRWVRSSIFPIKNPNCDGKNIFLHTVIDVTERKLAEERLKTSHEQLRRISAHLESVREEEKKKIARDLHDEASQLLASLSVHLEAAIETLPEEAVKTKAILKKSQAISIRILDQLHKMIYDLRPALLDELGLIPAISSLADSHLTVSGVKVTLTSSGIVRKLQPKTEIILFRIVQEAFNNIIKHACASQVQVKVDFKTDRIKISIKDDGTGFNVKDVVSSRDKPLGMGLLGMEERIKLIDGSILIKSNPGRGTQILIEAPLIDEKHNG